MKYTSLFLVTIAIKSYLNSSCPLVKLQTNPKVNLTEYIRKTWYVQQQQINGYQKEDDLYCVAATYNKDNHSNVPFFNGDVISVYNYANLNRVNGIHTNNNTVLCARVENNTNPEKLTVAPCFLPNLFGGPYWIVEAGPYPNNYEWAIISGGQPSVRVDNDTCTNKLEGLNGSGLWLFSRTPIMNETTINYLHKLLYNKGISSKYLLNVTQVGCKYDGAFIK